VFLVCESKLAPWDGLSPVLSPAVPDMLTSGTMFWERLPESWTGGHSVRHPGSFDQACRG